MHKHRPRALLAILVIAACMTLSACSSAQPTADVSHTAKSHVPKPAVTEAAPTVPDLVDQTAAQAADAASTYGLVLTIRDRSGVSYPVGGTRTNASVVTSQSIKAGSILKPGANLVVTITAPAPLVVPNVKGLSEPDAESRISDAGLQPQELGEVEDGWSVSAQSPAPGTKNPPGGTVHIRFAAPQVVYKISANGGTVSITYSSSSGDTVQATGARTPWAHTMPESDDEDPFYYISAQLNSGTEVSCSIYDDGVLVDHSTSTGQYSIVSCQN
jgi:beta-lactam-binding protein with PASTA domain/predicted small secreted protein